MTKYCGIWLLITLLLGGALASAQTDCGTADRLDFPIDRNQFTMVQGYAVPSVRHQGRFHTGEDWYGGRDVSAGMLVRAIAAGRVTYSNPTAWGRDGGVVIIEHTFTDGSMVYSMFGHINDVGAAFPQQFGCVNIGDVIGSIADGVRPAPHLHFEIRTANGDTPGQGYIRETPDVVGNLSPSAFILNQQTWLRPSHVFHTAVPEGITEKPVRLRDGSLLYLDSTSTLRRALPDGRVLWRNRLEVPAVSVSAWQGQSVLAYADGTFQVIDVETGDLGERWRVSDFAPTGAPFELSGYLVFPEANNRLTAIDETRRNVVWRIDDVPPFVRTFVANEGVNAIIGLLTEDKEVLQIAGSGVIVSRTQIRHPADFADNTVGDLLVYSWGGLYSVGIDSVWRDVFSVPHGGQLGAVWRGDGGMLLFDGAILTAYDNTNTLLWQTAIPDVIGWVSLERYNGIVALISTGGTIAAIGESGTICNQAQVAPQRSHFLWQELGEDGVWRFAIANHLIGLEWGRFTQGC